MRDSSEPEWFSDPVNTDGIQPTFKLTLIDNSSLPKRLGAELAFVAGHIRMAWHSFKSDPADFVTREVREHGRQLWSRTTPQILTGSFVSITILVTAILLVSMGKGSGGRVKVLDQHPISPVDVVTLEMPPEYEDTESSIGMNSDGRVGFRSGRGEGSNTEPAKAQGGGGGGDLDRESTQQGGIPPPSEIQARIPNTPPRYAQSLPVAGVDIDPLLWKDLSYPVYGDPRSRSSLTSNGPGKDGGMGDGRGLGVGEGDGPGVGPGQDGNIGDNRRSLGSLGGGGSSGCGTARCVGTVLTVRQVDQRARLLAKPEPQYTEEARRNQIMGTVILRVVFSSSGEVTNIQAVKTLPFGLTERAIVAARRIQFVPALKDGHPVSVHMQLEYNFNLY